MQKLRTPLLVLLALVAFDLVVLATADTWRRHSPDDYAERVNRCREQPQDLVIVGGSPVSEGIIPTLIAVETLPRVYSLGLPGGTTTEFFHAVKLACPTPPKVLLYGITASDLNDSRNEPHGPASLMSFRDTLDCMTLRPDAREWMLRQYLLARLSRNWSLWQHRHGIRMWATLKCEQFVPGSCPDTIREAKELRDYADALRRGDGYAPAAGFVHQRYDHVKAVGSTLAPFAFLNKYRTGSHQRYLHKLITWCETNDVQFLLLDMPVTEDLEKEYPQAFAEYRKLLAEEEHTQGLTVLRANRESVGLTDADFADTIHLNCVGAAKLSTWLQQQLSRPTPDAARVRAQVGGQP
jgi:hypothetical protein